MAAGYFRIGTSGWTYKGWKGPFYPSTVRTNEWLKYYASRFTTTEINGSFYRTPSLDAVRVWQKTTPKDFLFAWKALEVYHPLEAAHGKIRELDRIDGKQTGDSRAKAWSGIVPAAAAVFKKRRTP